MIAVVEFAAWVLVAACERALSGPWRGATEQVVAVLPPLPAEPAPPVAEVAAAPVEAPPPEPVPAEPVAPPPPPAAEPAQEAPPRPPLPVSTQPPPAPPARSADGIRWNVWTLEQLVQERAPENEELGFLIVYLRDFADSDGLLPAGFDALVRESFGELLPRAE